jgi:hypothetical protein
MQQISARRAAPGDRSPGTANLDGGGIEIAPATNQCRGHSRDYSSGDSRDFRPLVKPRRRLSTKSRDVTHS